MYKIRILLIILIIQGLNLYAQKVEDNTLFEFDKKVDNVFLKPYTYPGDSNYFVDFFSVDSALSTRYGYHYGIGTEKHFNLGYYFDITQKTKYLGYNEDTGETALKLVDKTAVTSSGRAYIIDCIDEKIYYWSVYESDTFMPHGVINKKFKDLEDIYTTENDDLYILDAGSSLIYKYSTALDSFLSFTKGDSLSYESFYSHSWGAARGLVVKNNYIFLLFNKGVVVKLDQEGNLVKRFTIGSSNLGLVNSYDSNKTETLTVSIALGLFGNIYIADSVVQSIHIFTDNLEYISTWSLPDHPIYSNVRDISFSPMAEHLFAAHPWGLYSFKIHPNVSGIKVDRNSFIPEYLSQDYAGINLSYYILGRGLVDVVVEGNNKQINLNSSVVNNGASGYSLLWNGKDNYGNSLPYGSYNLKLFFNNEAKKTIPLILQKDNNLTVKEPGNRILTNNNYLIYSFDLKKQSDIEIRIKDKNGIYEKVVKTENYTPGSYQFYVMPITVDEEAIDGDYEIVFKASPEDININLEAMQGQSYNFHINKTDLKLTNLKNNRPAFSPLLKDLDSISTSFTINEGCEISYKVLSSNGNTVYSLPKSIYFSSGSHNFTWKGYKNDNSLAKDGFYRFEINAVQKALDHSLSKRSDSFELDTTPPKTIFSNNSKDIYYLSTTSESSIGIKDSLGSDEKLIFHSDEKVTSTAYVTDSSGDVIINLFSNVIIQPFQKKEVFWNGKNKTGSYVKDGRYYVNIVNKDKNGLISTNKIPVIIDNLIYCTITSPGKEFTSYNDFEVSGVTRDTNIDKYTLSFIDESGSITGVLTSIKSHNNGKISLIDITKFRKDEYYNIKLEIFDKAGNYAASEVSFYRPYSIEEFYKGFNLNREYVNLKNTPVLNSVLLKQSNVSIDIEDSLNSSKEKTVSIGQTDRLKDYTLDISGVNDGIYDININASYNGYNYVYTKGLVIDNTKPAISLEGLEPRYSFHSDLKLHVNINDTNISESYISISKTGQSASVLYTGNYNVNNNPIVLSPVDYKEGKYELTFYAEDKAGNTSIYTNSFEIDRTPPLITLSDNALNEYFLSSLDQSSVGIKDNIGIDSELSFSINETGFYRAEIIDPYGNSINQILEEQSTDSGNSINFSWDGKDSLNQYVEDGKYLLTINSKDLFDNVSKKQILVYIDNNRLTEDDLNTIVESQPIKNFITTKDYNRIYELEDKYLERFDDNWGQFFNKNCEPLGEKFELYDNTNKRLLNILPGDRNFFYVISESFDFNSDDMSYRRNLYINKFSNYGKLLNEKVLVFTHIYNGVDFFSPFCEIFKVDSTFLFIENKSKIDEGIVDYSVVHRFDNFFNSIDSFNVDDWPDDTIRSNSKNLYYTDWIRKSLKSYNYSTKESRVVVKEVEYYELYDNDLYYTNNSPNDVIIYKVKPDGAVTKTFFKGFIDLQKSSIIKRVEDSFILIHKGTSGNGDKNYIIQFLDENLHRIKEDEYINTKVLSSPYIFIDSNRVNLLFRDENYSKYFRLKKYTVKKIVPGNNLTVNVSSPVEDSLRIKDNLNITGTVSDEYFDKYYVNRIDSLGNAEVVYESAEKVSEDTIYSIQLSDLEKDKSYTYEIVGVDKAGNTRLDKVEVIRQYDPNDFIVDFKLDNSKVSNNQNGLLSLELIKNASYELKIYSSNGILKRIYNYSNSGFTEHDLDIAGFEDGTYSVDVIVSYQGQVFNQSINFEVDNTNPVIDLKEPGRITSLEEVPLKCSMLDNNLRNYDIVLLDKKNKVVKTLKVGNKSGEVSGVKISPDALDSGEYKVSFNANDTFNNKSNLEYNFVIDKISPVITFNNELKDLYYLSPNEKTSINKKDSIGSDQSIDFSFNEETLLTIYITDKNNNKIKTIENNNVINVDQKYSINWDGRDSSGSFVKDGTYNLKVEYSDLYKNSGIKNFLIVIDNNSVDEESLVADILLDNNIVLKELTNVRGQVRDKNLSHYTVSLIDKSLNSKVLKESYNPIVGSIIQLNPGDYSKNSHYKLVLSAYDKADNKKESVLNIYRPYTNEEFIKEFKVDNKFLSSGTDQIVTINLLQKSSVKLYCKNLSDNASKVIDLSSDISSLNHVLSVLDMSDGAYELTLEAEYHGITYKDKVNFTVDSILPEFKISNLNDFYTDQEKVLLNGNILEDNLKSYSIKLFNSNNELIDTYASEILIYPSSLPEDNYRIVIDLEDMALNKNTVEASFIIDRTSPVINLDTPVENSVYSSVLDIIGELKELNGIDQTIISLRIDNELVYNDYLDKEKFALKINNLKLINKVYYADLELRSLDYAGNETVFNRKFIIDNLPPETYGNFSKEPYIQLDNTFISPGNKLAIDIDLKDEYSELGGIQVKINNEDWKEYINPLSFDNEGEYSVSFKSWDNLNNVSDVKSLSFIVDNTKPTVEVKIDDPKYLKGNSTYVPLNNNVNFIGGDYKGTVNSGLLKLQYSYDQVVWKDYKLDSLNFDKEGLNNIYIKGIDNVGNEEIVTLNNLIVDIVAPITLIKSDTELYYSTERNIVALKDSDFLSLEATDIGNTEAQSGFRNTFIKENSSYNIYKNPLFIAKDQLKNISFYSVDNVLNKEKEQQVKVAVDYEKPVVEITSKEDVYIEKNNIYSRTGNEFYLNAKDNFSGVNKLLYKVNNSKYKDFKSGLNFPEELDYQLTYFATDYIGLDSIKYEKNIRIDDTAPSTIIQSNLDIVKIGEKLYFDSRYKLSWRGIDSKSGVKETFVTVNGNILKDHSDFSIKDDGIYIVEYYSVDHLGNTERINKKELISPIPDRTAPKSKIVFSYDPLIIDDAFYAKSDINLLIKSKDLISGADSYASGVNKTMYSVNNEPFNEYYSNEISFKEGVNTLEYYSIDNIGNTEAVNKLTITIDDTSPESSVLFDTKGITTSGYAYISEKDHIALEAHDNYVGVMDIYFSVNGGEWTRYIDSFTLEKGLNELAYYSEDLLGNKEDIKNVKINTNIAHNRIGLLQKGDYLLYKDLDQLEINSDYIAYTLVNDNNSLYIQRNLKDLNIYSSNITLPGNNLKHSITSLKNTIITSESTEFGDHIFKYDALDNNQIGSQISTGDKNGKPEIIDNKVYWVMEQSGINSIMCYDILSGDSSIVYSSKDTFKSARLLNGSIFYVFNSDNGSTLLTVSNDSFNEIFIENKIVNSFISNSALITYELDSKIIIADKENPNIQQLELNGREHILINNIIYYIEENPDSNLLKQYVINTGRSSSVIIGEKIKSLDFNDKQLYLRVKKIIDNDLFTIGNQLETNNETLIIYEIGEEFNNSLISNLNSDFTEIEYVSNNTLEIPMLLSPFIDSTYLFTENKTGIKKIEFQSNTNIAVFLSINKMYFQEYIDKGFNEFKYNPFTTVLSNWSNNNYLNEYVTVYKEYYPYQDVSLEVEYSEDPFVFILSKEKNGLIHNTWENTTIFNKDDVVLYRGQLYKASYYSTNNRPSEGEPWKRISNNSLYQHWDSKQVYDNNEIVLFNGQLYMTKWWTLNNKPDSGDPWQCISSENNIHTWSPNQTYKKGDVVSYNNNIYICKYYTKDDIPGLDQWGPWKLFE